MKLNLELFDKLRTRFAHMRHPQRFRMNQIAVKIECGAAMCFIGHTLELAGCKKRLKPKSKRNFNKTDATDVARSDYDFIDIKGKIVNDVSEEARLQLGLKHDQANIMFHSAHLETPKDAVEFIDEIIATNGESLKLEEW